MLKIVLKVVQDCSGNFGESALVHVLRRCKTSALTSLMLATYLGTVAFAGAQARLSTSKYICSDLKDLVFQQGAIVLNTKGTSVYRRFVADQSFCKGDEIARRINVPTKSEKCRLRYCAPSNSMNN